MPSPSSHSLPLFLAFISVASLCILGAASHGPSSATVIDAPLLTQKIGTNRSIIVDVNGNGHFKSVQAAIDSVPEGNSDWIIIHIRKGVYREKVHVPKSKPFIFMRGNGKGKTAIVFSESSADSYESATFKVEAENFVAFGLRFKNDAPTGIAFTPQNQSVAALVGADKAAFYHCAFLSTHNTLFDDKGRHYYDHCYIQGSVDFIFGRGQSIFESCEVFAITDTRLKLQGSITAHNRADSAENGGFVFNKGKVYGIGEAFLGKAKGAYSRVIFANTYISKTIIPQGWTNWSYPGSTQNLYQAEYNCHGPGAGTHSRAPWTRLLRDEEAAPFLTLDFINGKEWLPAWL